MAMTQKQVSAIRNEAEACIHTLHSLTEELDRHSPDGSNESVDNAHGHLVNAMMQIEDAISYLKEVK